MQPSQKQIRKFWFYVDRRTPSECWPWIGAKTKSGYGTLTMRIPGIQKEQHYAHRIAYFLCKGEIPPGYFILHSCDTPACVNPAHLTVGTNQENLQDAHDRGLFPVVRKDGPYKHLNKNAILEICNKTLERKWLRDKYKLTMDQITYIRSRGIIMIDKLGLQ